MSAHKRARMACRWNLVLAVTLLLAVPAARAAEQQAGEPPGSANDLREFRVGMPVAALPASGYKDLVCAAAPEHALASWSEFRACPADPAGRHAVRFAYDEQANPMARLNDRFQGTRVAGQPVRLSLLLGDDDRLDGLRIETDPDARLYLRKKAFLFADQVRARFGSEGWTCAEGKPQGDEEPVGGVFYREHCEKRTDTRHFVLDRELYRHAGQKPDSFVEDTSLLIEPR